MTWLNPKSYDLCDIFEFKTISFVEFVQTKDKNWNTNIINCIHWHEMIFLRNSSFLKWTQMTPGRFLRGLARCIWCWFHISIGFNPLLKVNFYSHQSPTQTSGQILNRRSWVKVDGLLGINWMIKTTKSGQSSKVNNAVIFLTAHFHSKDRSLISLTTSKWPFGMTQDRLLQKGPSTFIRRPTGRNLDDYLGWKWTVSWNKNEMRKRLKMDVFFRTSQI